MVIATASGVATTILTCQATEKAKKIINDNSLSKKDKAIGVVKCYIAPIATTAVTIGAASEVINGYKYDIREMENVLTESNRLLNRYRTNNLNQIGVNKEREMFERSLLETCKIPPKEVFKSLKPNEILFYHFETQKYWATSYQKMMEIDKCMLDKINNERVLECTDYYKKLGLSSPPFTAGLRWQLDDGENWSEFQYYVIYDIKDNGESIGKFGVVHPFCPIKKQTEVIDVEYKEAD
jgi:hypothetical protein